MEPSNAHGFDATPDLGGYWVYKGMEMIEDLLSVERHKINWQLEVASQGFAEACKIGYLIEINAIINFEYQPDEWSLTGYYYNDDMNIIKEMVWSAGA